VNKRTPYDDVNLPYDLSDAAELFQRWREGYTPGRWRWVFPGLLLLLWLASGLYVVGPGERGVVLLFGRAVEQTEPGLRYRLPWPIQSHATVDIAQVRRVEIGFRSGTDTPLRSPGRSSLQAVPHEALMLTGDENIVDAQLFVQYRVQDPVKFLFAAHRPEDVLHTSAQVALRSIVGQNTIDYTMTDGRVEVQEQVKTNLQHLLETYQTGLLVTEARLLVVDPPSEVRDAFHDVVRALEDRERLVKEADGYREDIVPKARGEAAQMVQHAQGYKAQRVIRAQGDAERFEKVLSEYQKAKDVTRDRLYLESMERVLPDIDKVIVNRQGQSDVLPILPLRGPAAESLARDAAAVASANSTGGK
jgi:membrane protease subunit HflK